MVTSVDTNNGTKTANLQIRLDAVLKMALRKYPTVLPITTISLSYAPEKHSSGWRHI